MHKGRKETGPSRSRSASRGCGGVCGRSRSRSKGQSDDRISSKKDINPREDDSSSRKRSESKELNRRENDRSDKRSRLASSSSHAQLTAAHDTQINAEDLLPDWAKKIIETTKQQETEVERRFEEIE
ncbi:hypothetical protein PC128_g438 [Phytophthora cactorum]|nr:hypothetical protein PC120_g138 [Phytophthora cactorum]KAG3101980.1 hypothetical protein PC121_g1327 [Phytophthora cactorum]KAG3206810.1 hypothetical protein PC128_g438 [Phytophthora cactorum]KAG4064690.1 hypothetical protein PC123_g422 [Phytophthora cactorum]